MTLDQALARISATVQVAGDPELDQALDVIQANIGIPVDDIISSVEVRAMAGIRSRHTLIDWRERRGFPRPFKTVDGRVELYDRRDVEEWLARRR